MKSYFLSISKCVKGNGKWNDLYIIIISCRVVHHHQLSCGTSSSAVMWYIIIISCHVVHHHQLSCGTSSSSAVMWYIIIIISCHVVHHQLLSGTSSSSAVVWHIVLRFRWPYSLNSYQLSFFKSFVFLFSVPRTSRLPPSEPWPPSYTLTETPSTFFLLSHTLKIVYW